MPEPAPLPPLIERLGSDDRKAQRQACDDALSELQRNPTFRREITRLLDGGPKRARFSAAFVLFRAGQANLRLLPALLEALDLDDGDLRWSAAHMLTTLGRMHGEILPVVLHESKNARTAHRRRMALYVLRELAPEHEKTRASLLEALADSDPEVRRAALSSVAKLPEPDLRCAERVLSVLAGDVDPRMRRIAAAVLPDLVARCPEVGEAARQALRSASGATDPALARAARTALARIGAGTLA